MGYFHKRKKRLISLMNIIQDNYFCNMFINSDLKMNDNQASRGAFWDTSFVIIRINLIKHEA